MGIIDVENLNFSYDEDTTVINNVSFSIEKGTYTTIVGHNGSGKSTIAKLLAGLLEKKSGSIKIDNLEMNYENLSQIRNKIGIVFQNPDNQFIGSTVRDDIAFGLENHCVPQEKMDDIINENATRVKMDKFLDKEPTHLSGGQKQRVAIAGVLAMKPDIIIFDEATAMLDPQGKDEIKKVIMDLHKEEGMTIISITHDIDEVINSDYVIALKQGELFKSGKPEEVFDNDQNIIDIMFDLPFSLKLEKELHKRGLKVSRNMSMEGLVDELCQLSSKI